jgi:hypothetical protein
MVVAKQGQRKMLVPSIISMPELIPERSRNRMNRENRYLLKDSGEVMISRVAKISGL